MRRAEEPFWHVDTQASSCPKQPRIQMFQAPAWSVGAFLTPDGANPVLCPSAPSEMTRLWPGPRTTWESVVSVMSKDPKTLPRAQTQWVSASVSCSALQNAFKKKEVGLLGGELGPFVDCICVQGAGLFTIFPEKWLKSRVKSRKGIKAVQELITTINFAETSWCFADSLVLFWQKYSEDASVNSQHWLLCIFHFCSTRLFLAAVH